MIPFNSYPFHVIYPFSVGKRKQFISRHRTLEAAEKRVKLWTSRHQSSGIPHIIDSRTGKNV